MVRLFMMGCILALTVGTLGADDKDSKPVTWEREVNGLDLKMDVSKDTMKISVFQGCNGVIVGCKYTTDKDGVIKATITSVDMKGMFPATPKMGTEFKFKWKVSGDTATLSDYDSKELPDAKDVLEGEYKKKK